MFDDDLPQDDPIARLIARAREGLSDRDAFDVLIERLREDPELDAAMAGALRRFLDERGTPDAP